MTAAPPVQNGTRAAPKTGCRGKPVVAAVRNPARRVL